MTSEEIRVKQAADLTTNGWLREVAYQLALLNEKRQLAQQLSEKRR